MGCGRREVDSGKLSKIAGERVAQRRQRWDSEALRVISGEGVDEIVNTFANVLRITHDGPMVPRKLGGAVFFMGIIKQGSSDLMRRDSQWCGGTIWEKWDIWGIWEKGQTAPNDQIPSDARFGKIRKTASAVGPNNRGEHNCSHNLCAEPAACGGSGVDGIRHGARSGGGGVDGISAHPDGAACAHDLGGASTVGCCDYTPYYFGDFMAVMATTTVMVMVMVMEGITVSQEGKLRRFGIEFTAEAKKLMRGKALTTNLQVCHMYLETLDPAFSVVLKVTVSSAQLMRNRLGVQAPAAVIGPAIAPRKKGDPIDLVDLIKMAEDMAASQPEGGSTFDIPPEKEITRATHFPTIKQEPRDEKMEEINGVLTTLRDTFLTSQTQQHEHHSEILKSLQQVAKGVPPHKDIPIANSGNQSQGSNNYQPERWNNPAKSSDNNGDCFYCELQGHISRNCPHKEEHITKGWLGIENGKTRLGDGGSFLEDQEYRGRELKTTGVTRQLKQGQSQAQSSYYQSDENESQQDWTETAMDEIRTLKVRLAKAESVNNQNNLPLANTHRAVQPAFMASTQAATSFTQELDLGQTLQALLLRGSQSVSENQGIQDHPMMGAKKRKPARPPEDRIEANSEKSQNWRRKAKGIRLEESEDEDEKKLPAITKQRRVRIAEVVTKEGDNSGDSVAKNPYKDVPPIDKQPQDQRITSDRQSHQGGYIPNLEEKAYRVKAPVQQDGLPIKIAKRIAEVPVTLNVGEVWGISPEVRDLSKGQLTKVRVPIKRKVVKLVAEEQASTWFGFGNRWKEQPVAAVADSILPNSAGPERAFSVFGLTHTRHRNRLEPQKVHDATTFRMDRQKAHIAAGLVHERKSRRFSLDDDETDDATPANPDPSDFEAMSGTLIRLTEREAEEDDEELDVSASTSLPPPPSAAQTVTDTNTRVPAYKKIKLADLFSYPTAGSPAADFEFFWHGGIKDLDAEAEALATAAADASAASERTDETVTQPDSVP
ncbi:hypothetical protein B0H17DRAFT_1134153 [Mycena rosella]|uniref:CCHC-type domain-containing protein n=1 Tax=Mycena rosella TaxID=1033263 RepID=A0AAD7DGT5_MYCRO|nr:hypothetical protein B0H17DRAFT_1134153 [Mycena rosella]